MVGYRCFWGLFCIFVTFPVAAVEISGVQPFALDQPRVYAMLQRPGQSGPLMDSFGAFTFDAFLDTGASGFILSRDYASFLGVQNQQIAGQNVEFATVGASGSAGFNISEILNVGISPYHPDVPLDDLSTIATTYTHGVDAVRIQVEQNFTPINTSPINVIGMPAMVNKVVVMDPTPVDSFLNTMNTFIYDPGTPFHPSTTATDPGIPTTTHNVQLSFGDFSRFTQVTPVGGSLPTLARNPFIGPDPISALDPGAPADDTPPVELSFGGRETTGSFLLDTGAGVSFVSRALASNLNIRYRPGSFGTAAPKLESYDPNNVGQPGTLLAEQFTLNIGGVGGSSTLAGFYVDSMRLKTVEGNVNDDNDPHHLEFVRTPVLVNDIQLKDPDTGDLFTLTGVFGMNNLVASANVTTIGGEPVLIDQTPGNFEWLVYDDANALLGFTFKDLPIEPGDFNADGRLDCSDIDGLVTTLSSQVNDIMYDMNADGTVNDVDLNAWLTAAGSLVGDADLDGTVGAGDLAIWEENAFSGDTSWCSADFNVDGVTDGSDFNVWLENNGATAAPLNATVPEPSGLTLLLIVAVIAPALRGRV
jgi:hypothetical protein